MKTPTSVTLHKTAEGQRVSYTYSVIDDATGAILQDNVRQSFIAAPAMADLQAHADAIMAAVAARLED